VFSIVIRKIYSFLVDTVQTLLLAAAVFLIIYAFLFRPFEVNGESMFPNFHNKEYILTNIITLHFSNPKLGDVIVFKAPNDPEKDYIKRVIGVAGDRIIIKDADVYLNGVKLSESAYLEESVKTYAGSFLRDQQEITVPQDQYFVLGDNRSNSSDSREWGFVSVKSIIGKSFFAYWPPKDVGIVKNPYR